LIITGRCNSLPKKEGAGYSVVAPPKVVKLAAPVENNEETGDAEPAKKPAKKK